MSPLFTDLGYWGLVAAAIALASIARAWFSLRRTQVQEKAQTDRFTKAIDGTNPEQRPAIIRALARSADPEINQ